MRNLNDFFQKYLKAKADVSKKQDCDTPRHLPMFRIIIEPIGLVIDFFRIYIYMALWWALIMSAVSFLMKNPYMCLISEYRLHHSCGENIFIYILLHILLLFFTTCVMVRWGKVVFNKEKLNLKQIITPQWGDIKAFGVLLVLILLNCTSLFSMWLLFKRVPNPDYKIEMVYFTFAGSGMVVPFIMMRFYSMLGFALIGEKIPSLKSVWKRSRGNGMRILVSLGLIFLISVFSMAAFNSKISLAEDKNSLYISWVVEYLYNMLILLLAVFFANHCLLQKKYLFEREKNDD